MVTVFSVTIPGVLEVALEPGEGVLPGPGGLLLIVSRTGVVVECVPDAGIDVDLVDDAGFGQGLFEGVLAGVDATVLLGVDAKDGGLDVGDFVQVGTDAVEGNSGLEVGIGGGEALGDATAEAVAGHADAVEHRGAALAPEKIDRQGDVAGFGEAAGDIADVLDEATIFVTDQDGRVGTAGGGVS